MRQGWGGRQSILDPTLRLVGDEVSLVQRAAMHLDCGAIACVSQQQIVTSYQEYLALVISLTLAAALHIDDPTPQFTDVSDAGNIARVFEPSKCRGCNSHWRWVMRARAEASDYDLNRVKAALEEGLAIRDAAARLNLPLEAVERLRQLIDWRYGHEIRYTLTDEALALLDEQKDDKAA